MNAANKTWTIASAMGGPVGEAIAANRRLLLAIFGFSAAMSILALTTSFYMLQVYDRVLTSRSPQTLTLLTLIAIAGLTVFGWLDAIRLRLQQRVATRMADALGKTILRSMVATSSQSGGVTIRNGLRDLDTVRSFLGSQALTTLMDAPYVIVYLVVLALLHWLLLVIVLVGGGVLIALAWTNQALTNQSLTRALESQMRAHTFADDGLRNADVLEGMGMSAVFVEHWHGRWINAMRLATMAADRDAVLTATSRTVRLIIQSALLGAGAWLILNFQATGGIMIAASIIGSRALAPIDGAVAAWKNFISLRLAWTRLDDTITGAPRRDEGMALPAPEGTLHAIKVGYGIAQTRRVLLNNINLELLPGESLGVIGPSGSGKSTLLRLLVGAWPCSTGSVRLDGAEIYAWPRTELRRYVGYLPQDVELFAGTVRENIARLGDSDPAEVVRAAQLAGAHEVILGFPKGYETELGQHGYRLSGGQAQRVGIARALFGEPRLVILDEPNANLDGAGEEALAKTLAQLRQDRVTVVIVSHRPSILGNVDKVMALRVDGSVDAYGPRAEVVEQFMRRPPPAPPGKVVAIDQGARP